MLNRAKFCLVAAFILLLSACATVEMESVEQDTLRKEFADPSNGKSGLYIYRNSIFGTAVKKSLRVDGIPVGAPAIKTFFYVETDPGALVVSTDSEFGNNDVTVDTVAGQNYFIRQYLKMGLMVAGANLELVSIEKGKKGVLECKLAKSDYENW